MSYSKAIKKLQTGAIKRTDDNPPLVELTAEEAHDVLKRIAYLSRKLEEAREEARNACD